MSFVIDVLRYSDEFSGCDEFYINLFVKTQVFVQFILKIFEK